MLHQDFVDLVDEILSATKADTVNWKDASKAADKEPAPGVSFLAKYTQYSILINAIDRPVLGVDNRDYAIDIIENTSGRALERITAAAYGDAKNNPIQGYATMAEIFKLAQWKATNIRAALAEIMSGLKNPPPQP